MLRKRENFFQCFLFFLPPPPSTSSSSSRCDSLLLVNCCVVDVKYIYICTRNSVLDDEHFWKRFPFFSSGGETNGKRLFYPILLKGEEKDRDVVGEKKLSEKIVRKTHV